MEPWAVKLSTAGQCRPNAHLYWLFIDEICNPVNIWLFIPKRFSLMRSPVLHTILNAFSKSTSTAKTWDLLFIWSVVLCPFPEIPHETICDKSFHQRCWPVWGCFLRVFAHFQYRQNYCMFPFLWNFSSIPDKKFSLSFLEI